MDWVHIQGFIFSFIVDSHLIAESPFARDYAVQPMKAGEEPSLLHCRHDDQAYGIPRRKILQVPVERDFPLIPQLPLELVPGLPLDRTYALWHKGAEKLAYL